MPSPKTPVVPTTANFVTVKKRVLTLLNIATTERARRSQRCHRLAPHHGALSPRHSNSSPLNNQGDRLPLARWFAPRGGNDANKSEDAGARGREKWG